MEPNALIQRSGCKHSASSRTSKSQVTTKAAKPPPLLRTAAGVPALQLEAFTSTAWGGHSLQAGLAEGGAATRNAVARAPFETRHPFAIQGAETGRHLHSSSRLELNDHNTHSQWKALACIGQPPPAQYLVVVRGAALCLQVGVPLLCLTTVSLTVRLSLLKGYLHRRIAPRRSNPLAQCATVGTTPVSAHDPLLQRTARRAGVEPASFHHWEVVAHTARATRV